SPAQITAAADAGARMSTHLGNGVHALLPRHPNYIWAQLAETRLTASFVADGHHLPVDTFVAMLRAKARRRRILVSDSVAIPDAGRRCRGRPRGRASRPFRVRPAGGLGEFAGRLPALDGAARRAEPTQRDRDDHVRPGSAAGPWRPG